MDDINENCSQCRSNVRTASLFLAVARAFGYSYWCQTKSRSSAIVSPCSLQPCLYSHSDYFHAKPPSRVRLKTRHEHRHRYLAIERRYHRLRSRVPCSVSKWLWVLILARSFSVSTHSSCGPQRSKNYIQNIPLGQDWCSDVTRPFLSCEGSGTPDLNGYMLMMLVFHAVLDSVKLKNRLKLLFY